MAKITSAHCEIPTQTPGRFTPAGLQSLTTLTWRRVSIVALVATMTAILGGIWASMLAQNGLDWLDAGLIALFIFSLPWTVLGFWNALIGFWLLHVGGNWRASVAPFLDAGNSDGPVNLKTAILMTLRNEDPERALNKLERVRRSLDATGHGQNFDFFILSDTSDPEIAEIEERIVEEWRKGTAVGRRVVYRRREQNTGFKAGNVRDFVERWGGEYDLMLPLDADSLMSGPAILRMVRIMQGYPRFGILQSLVVGTPTRSAFARIFQFGMRHGMRSYTMGSAWWQGDCGPFWGHNALVRVKPFAEHCQLPMLPGKPPLGGHVLSHDQVEAAMMRGAGYEVRVIPIEDASWEDNPPTLLDFAKRDLRWCQGNMQYWKLVGMPGLTITSRVQLVIAIMMYLSAAAWMGIVALGGVKIAGGSMETFDPVLGVAMFATIISMSLMPKLMGLLDVALTPGGVARYGGGARFAAGAVIETAFMMLLAPVIAFAVTVFMIGLLFGRSVKWNGQARDAYRLTWRTAAGGLWPQTLYGLGLAAIFATNLPDILPWVAPMLGGLILAVPLAVLSAAPEIGTLFARWGLCATPEELDTPIELQHEMETDPFALAIDTGIGGAVELPAASTG